MKKILLAIDDEKSILSILEYIFEKKYNVINKPNGKEALAWMQEGNLPDVIVSDVLMPEMDGFEFMKQKQSSGFFKDIPLIILSSNENSTDKIKFLCSGADDYMVKPFNPQELDIRVNNLLKRVDKTYA